MPPIAAIYRNDLVKGWIPNLTWMKISRAALKNAKQYALVGVGIGYYTKYATLNIGVYQSRDTLFTAGNSSSGVSGGLAVKF
jgi:hypothetical protein